MLKVQIEFAELDLSKTSWKDFERELRFSLEDLYRTQVKITEVKEE